MLNYKHILLTTDLAPNTHEVAKRAREMAKISDAKVSLLHVLEYTPSVYSGGEFSIPVELDIEKTLLKHANQSLAELGSEYGIATANQYIKNGSVKTAVAELAEKIEADLILVGSHGHNGLEALLGSTANAILHHAACDVLAVRMKDASL